MTAPPAFLRLAGHPVRWRLLRELSRGDQRVGELVAAAGERQSLVSYHLRLLRDGGLVTARRSLADGRDTYYVLDLERCGALLAHAGAALHAGLAPGTAANTITADVLFLCTGNSARSQMAEALASSTLNARSAGSHPKALHPLAVETMRARSIDIAGRRAKHLHEFLGTPFDYVITLCDKVREVCPDFPAESIHWSLREPHTPEEFEACAAELETRIRFLIEGIRHA